MKGCCSVLAPQANHIHGMFPHIPLHAITLDLADTHSVSLTVERILNNTIYIPSQEGAPPPDPPPTPSQHVSTHLASLTTRQEETNRSQRSSLSTPRHSTSTQDSDTAFRTALVSNPEVSENPVLPEGGPVQDGVTGPTTDPPSLDPPPEPSGLRQRRRAGVNEGSIEGSPLPNTDGDLGSDLQSSDRSSGHQSDRSSDSGVSESPLVASPITDQLDTVQFVRRGGANTSTALTNPSSPYSFYALQQRKKSLLDKARR